MYQPRSFSNDSVLDSALSTTNPMMNTFSTQLSRSSSDPATVPFGSKEHRVSSTVSVKRLRRSDIANMDNIQKLNENKNINSFSNGDDNNSKDSSDLRRPTVTVLGMNRLPNMGVTNRKGSSVVSAVPSQTTEINLSKVPRIKSITNRRTRAASVDNVSVIHVDRSSIEMQPMGNRSKTGSGVRVTKLPRRLSAAQSHFT